MRALIIEDQDDIVALTRYLLEQEGFQVDAAGTCEEGTTLALVNDYDAIVLDLGLPDRNGLSVVQTLRSRELPTPILILTGNQDSAMTVRALDAGADDYVTKPLVPEAFRARIRALVRRGGATRSEMLTFGNVTVNRLTRRALCEGNEIPLTARELALLEHLIMRAEHVITRTTLLEKVWDMNFDPGTNAVDVAITRLRKKLEGCEATVKIVAKRGEGFVLSLG